MGLRYALAGNPNSGKTTLFNALTGANQYVGNWPGVTVEKKEGTIREGKTGTTLVDLPGIYSLSPYSGEELVTRNYIIEEKPDLIINIVDATNLERNLYLSLQLAELGVPMVLALNMMDVVRKRGDSLDVALLSSLTGFRVVPISAAKGEGIRKLLRAAEHELAHTGDSAHIDRHTGSGLPEFYSGKLRETLAQIREVIAPYCQKAGLPPRWAAVKLVEGDAPTRALLQPDAAELAFIEAAVAALEKEGQDREIVVADQKYKFICAVRDKVLVRAQQAGSHSLSDKIDRIVTNRFLAIPLFALVMLTVFYITFGALGGRLVAGVDTLVNVWFSDFVRDFLVSHNVADWLTGLICDGAIAGIGSVLAFLPQIALLFLFLSILEDSGYMARGAFIMDRALHAIGLSGKSFVPMLMGFGCSVPALMATRALANEKDRRLTVMLVPFMSCSAKMPFYALMIPAIFSRGRGLAVFSLYALGIVVAVLAVFLLQKTVLRGGHAPFVMELPPYRLPTAKTLWRHLWEKVRDFLSKAGTVLLLASVLIWALQYFSPHFQPVADSADSILGHIGRFIAPIFAPLGFGDWRSAVAMLSGLMARESIVSTLGILHGTGGEATQGLTAVLSGLFTPPAGYAFMTFSLLFIPCVAAMAAVRREMNSAKWTAFAFAFQTGIAWVVSFAVYQIGNLIWMAIR